MPISVVVSFILPVPADNFYQALTSLGEIGLLIYSSMGSFLLFPRAYENFSVLGNLIIMRSDTIQFAVVFVILT